MRFTVTLEVDINLDDWAAEYGVSTAEALTQAMGDLALPGWYLQGEKWVAVGHLAGEPKVVIELDKQPAKTTQVGATGVHTVHRDPLDEMLLARFPRPSRQA